MERNSYGELTTEALNKWWETMKQKGAEYLSLGKEEGTFKLHARKHGEKQRLGQKSLGTTNKRIAIHAIETLLTDTSNTSPASVVKQYHEHKLRMVDACRDKERHLRFVLPRIKTAKTNCSRLKCHLLPFCNKFHINDVQELYKRENVGKFLNYLDDTVPESATCASIVKTTKAFLHWYDRSSKVPLATREFEEAIQGYSRIFAHKIRKVKTFLSDDDVRKLLISKSEIPELKARILAHLVGGLRHNEIGGLRWCDLDKQQGHLVVSNAKGGIARYAQYPKCLCEAFEEIRRTRAKNIMPGDYVFTYHTYSQTNDIVQKHVQNVCGVSGKDLGGNCLRRSGCHSINMACPGLGDKQLGHANTSRITDTYYCDRTDFKDVNAYWDEVYKELTKSKGAIMGQEDPAIYAGKIITLTAS